MIQSCLCFSGIPYEKCCRRFHDGSEIPKNALELMRSRYSAYALDKPDYIIETTHPENSAYTEDRDSWRRSIVQFSKNTVFKGLEIHDFEEKKTKASVTFTAYLTQHGHDASFTEKSTFEKVGRHWLYKQGQLLKSG